MTFEEYQQFTDESTAYPIVGHGFVYPAIGLASETGEVVEKVKNFT